MSKRTVVNPNGTFLDKDRNKEIKEKVLKIFKRYFPNELIEAPELALIEYTNHIKDYEFNNKLEQLKKEIKNFIMFEKNPTEILSFILYRIEELKQ